MTLEEILAQVQMGGPFSGSSREADSTGWLQGNGLCQAGYWEKSPYWFCRGDLLQQ